MNRAALKILAAQAGIAVFGGTDMVVVEDMSQLEKFADLVIATQGQAVVYAFRFCHCIYETGMETRSLHQTKAGAYTAMRAYLKYQQETWEAGRRMLGNRAFMDKWHDHCAWDVVPVEVGAV